MQKLLGRFSQNSAEQWQTGSEIKKPLDSGGNPEYVMAGLGLRLRLGYS